jgi:hypothetical protein
MAGNYTIEYNGTTPLGELEAQFRAKGNRKILMFNRLSGAYVGCVITDTVSTLDKNKFKWKIKNFDDTAYQWVGDYDTGDLVPIADVKRTITEKEIDLHAGSTIEQSYPWHSQTNYIIDVVKKLIEANNLTGDEVDAFNTMASFIDGRRNSNRAWKQAYKDDDGFEFVTYAEQEQKMDNLYAGLEEIREPGVVPDDSVGWTGSDETAKHTDVSDDVDADTAY